MELFDGTVGFHKFGFIPSSYTLYLKEEDWIHEKGSYFMLIEKGKHGIGASPLISVFQKRDESYVPYMIHDEHDNKGNIRLEVSKKFDGKVVIS